MSLNKFVFTHGHSVSNGCVCMKSSVCILAGDESRHLVSSRLPRIHHMRSQAVPVSIYILLSMKRSRTRSRVTTSQASEVYILLGVKRSRTRLRVTIYILLSTKRPRPRPRDLRIHHMCSQAVPVSIYILLSMKRSRTRSRVTTSQASEVYILLGIKRSQTRIGVTIYILLSTKRPRPRPRDLRTPQPTTSCCECRQQRLLLPSTPACVNPTT